MEETSLNQKHRQALISIYRKLDWLCGTLTSANYIEVPSHLTNSRNSLRHVLIDCGVLENKFACECGVNEWRGEVAIDGRNECPECDSVMQRISTQVTH